jgi:hypothetical protein
MSLIVFQPAASPAARRNFTKTISSPVEFLAEPLLSDEQKDGLLRAHPDGRAALWGVAPGRSAQIKDEWEKLAAGDVVLFFAAGDFFVQGVVEERFENEQLARKLWGDKEPGVTFRYMYSIRDLRSIQWSKVEYNRNFGHEDDYPVRAFAVLSALRSDWVLDRLSDPPETTGGVDAARRALLALAAEDELDTRYSGTRRKEQAALKALLLGSNVHDAGCAICGRVLPIEMLWCAHIKPRRDCTLEERLNPRVVMLACLLGCDALFEKGWISVDADGLVLVSDAVHQAADAASHLAGRSVSAHDALSEPFFGWHRSNRLARLPVLVAD